MKEQSPLERAARALCRAQNLPEDFTGQGTCGDPSWMFKVKEVRAVLQAIREPSAAMIQASGVSKLEERISSLEMSALAYSYGDDPERQAIADHDNMQSDAYRDALSLVEYDWQAMVDAALDEEIGADI